MSYDDGLGLLGGGGELSRDAAILQQAAGNGKRGRGAKVNKKVTYVVSRQVDGSFAATATLGGGMFGGGQKKQFVAGSLGELLTQIGASARKTFTFGIQPNYAQMRPQEYPDPQEPPILLGSRPQARQSAPDTGKTDCPKCGAQVAYGKFCPDCGTQAPAKPTVRYCGECGEKVEAKKFCANCGAKQA